MLILHARPALSTALRRLPQLSHTVLFSKSAAVRGRGSKAARARTADSGARPVRFRLTRTNSLSRCAASPPHPPAPSAYPSSHSRDRKPHPTCVLDTSDLFSTRTRWLVHSLAEGLPIPRAVLFRIINSRDIPAPYVARWVRALNRKDPIYALQELGLLESAAPEDGQEAPPCPDWLYLSLPGLVSKPEHAPYLASQLLSTRFAELDEENRGLFVARCVQHFLKVRHYVALRETIDWVAYTPPPAPSASSSDYRPPFSQSSTGCSSPRSFGRILSALSSERMRYSSATATSAPIIHALANLIVRTMTNRGTIRTLETFLPLFSPKLIPTDPARAFDLLREMEAAGFAPKRQVLHAVTRVCASAGQGDMVQMLLREIEKVGKGKRARLGEVGLYPQRSTRVVPLDEGSGGVAHMVTVVEDEGEAEREEGMGEIEDQSDPCHTGAVPPVGSRATQQAGRGSLEYAHRLSDLPPSSSDRHDPGASSANQSSSRSTRYSTSALTPSIAAAYMYALAAGVTDRGTTRGAFPPTPFPFDSVTWTKLFHLVAADSSVPSSAILAAFRRLERRSPLPASALNSPPDTTTLPPLTLRLCTIVIRSLLVRGRPRVALDIWYSLEAKGWQPDAYLLAVLVDCHCALGREDLAARCLDHYAFLPSLHPPELLLSLRATNPNRLHPKRPHSVRLDTGAVNALLLGLGRARKYMEVWELLKSMEQRYEVKPDVASISIALDAARFASQAAGRGYAPPGMEDFSTLSLSAPLTSSVGDGASGEDVIASQFPTSFSGVVDDRWDGVPAAKRMEEFVWKEVLEANWQDLVEEGGVEDPLRWRQSGAGVSGWLADRFRSAPSTTSTSTSRSKLDSAEPGKAQVAVPPLVPPSNWRPFASTLSFNRPQHPHLFPTDPLFRSFVQLIGHHSHIRSIPLVLGWMKALQVRPSRWTLGLAMMYVDGETAVTEKEKLRFRRWLLEWLGVEGVPDQREIAWIRRGGGRPGKPVTR
ncbi:hypothetical protein JCM11641_001464 [Rhodosporidiobolus odoratus]